MKKVKLLLTMLFMLVMGHIMANNNETIAKKEYGASIQGHVISKKSGESLPYVIVNVKGTTLATTTDAKGHFVLKGLPEGKTTLEVKLIGYRTSTAVLTLQNNQTAEQNFTLKEDAISLDEIVLTANRQQTLRREAPVLVNVVDTRMYNLTNSATLAQGLNFQPGVRTETNCQNCGFNQVRINGLDGHYSQILIDSRPVFSALNGIYGLEQIPASMVERVEVVRGGGSSLYGASAIGGTINVITKEPVRNSADFSHTVTSIGGSAALENNTNVNASIITDDAKAGLFVYGNHHYRPGYDHDGDGFTELPNLNNRTVGFSSFYKFSPYSRLTLRYHNVGEFRRGGNMLYKVPHETDITEQLEHDINGGNLGYDFFSRDGKDLFKAYYSFENTARKSYYGGLAGETTAEAFKKANRAYGTTKELNYILGTQYVHNFDKLLFMPSSLTLGAEYSYDKMNDEVVGYDHYMKQHVRVWSGYFQNEWKNDKFTFLLGARVDKNNYINKAILSPRVNFRYNPSEELSLRLSYAEGFRAPQAFDEDLHTGWTDGTRKIIVRNPNLKEERSKSVSASADFYHTFGSVQTNFLIEGFYTKLINTFATTQKNKGEEGTPEYQENIKRYMQDYGLSLIDVTHNEIEERYNANSANIFGINLEAKAAFTKWLEVQAGLTLQKNLFKDSVEWNQEFHKKERRFLKTPNTYGYFTIKTTPFKNFTAALTGTYTGSMLVSHQNTDDYNGTINGQAVSYKGWSEAKAVNTPTFLTMNLKLAYDFALSEYLKLQVNAGIQNITNAYQKDFDKGPNRDADYIYGPAQPRSYFIGVKFSY